MLLLREYRVKNGFHGLIEKNNHKKKMFSGHGGLNHVEVPLLLEVKGRVGSGKIEV